MAESIRLLDAWLEAGKAFPKPDWRAVWDWTHQQYPADSLHDVYVSLGADWCARIAAAFPTRMAVTHSENFYLVAAESFSGVRSCLIQLEGYYAQVQKCLSGLDLPEGFGKHVVVMAPDLDSFTRYLSDYYPEGEFMMPGGVCLRHGYTHFLIREDNLTAVAPVLAHELTHACVTGIPWPAWVDEAVAQSVEFQICGLNRYELNREIVERHRRYWTPELMQGFWTGESFHFTDEGSELSYHLARFLLEAVAQNGRPAMMQFLRTAQAEDAAFEAFWNELGVLPSEMLVELLGEKDWAFHGSQA